MTSPIRLSELPLWERHHEKVLSIAREALQLLKAEWPVGDEHALNRSLYFCLLKANANAAKRGEPCFDYSPMWEAQNQPRPENEVDVEHKRPDFQWVYLDHEETDPTRSARNFVIECKRLGNPTPSGWVLNLHYVDDGIVRFVDPAWRYGRAVASGAMVGYIESMGFDDVFAEVQARLSQRSLASLNVLGSGDDLFELDHSLARSFALSPFRLVHLWIDHSGGS